MRIDASCSEDSPAGRFLGDLYYKTSALKLFAPGERLGFPNDGGQHTLVLQVEPADAEAFLDLVVEKYGWVNGCSEFVEHFRAQMH